MGRKPSSRGITCIMSLVTVVLFMILQLLLLIMTWILWMCIRTASIKEHLLCTTVSIFHDLWLKLSLTVYDLRVKMKPLVPIVFSLITHRKQSLRQGNVFECVCHSVHSGGLPTVGYTDYPPNKPEKWMV